MNDIWRSFSIKNCRQVWRKAREMLAGNQSVDMVQVQCSFCGSTSSGIDRLGRVVRPPRAAESNGRKNKKRAAK